MKAKQLNNDDTLRLLEILMAAGKISNDSVRESTIETIRQMINPTPDSPFRKQNVADVMSKLSQGAVETKTSAKTDVPQKPTAEKKTKYLMIPPAQRDAMYLKSMFSTLDIKDPAMTTRLSDMWSNGRELASRGLYRTNSFHTYDLSKGAGRSPLKLGYRIDGQHNLVNPPLALRIMAQDTARNALFVQFEQDLTGLSENFNGTKSEKSAKDDGRLALRGISWSEGVLGNEYAALSVPTISAALARSVLKKNKLVKPGLIDGAPLSLWNYDGLPSEDLANLCRRIVEDGGKVFRRSERLALARLCMIPLLRIERFIFDAAAGHEAMDRSENTIWDAIRNAKTRGIDFSSNRRDEEQPRIPQVKPLNPATAPHKVKVADTEPVKVQAPLKTKTPAAAPIKAKPAPAASKAPAPTAKPPAKTKSPAPAKTASAKTAHVKPKTPVQAKGKSSAPAKTASAKTDPVKSKHSAPAKPQAMAKSSAPAKTASAKTAHVKPKTSVQAKGKSSAPAKTASAKTDPVKSKHDAPAKPQEKAKSSVPVKAKSSAPVKAKSSAPVKAKSSAPVKAKSSVPVKAKSSVPVKAKSSVPVKAKSSVPVKAKSSVPVKAKSSAAPLKPQKPTSKTPAKKTTKNPARKR
jgi:hypothetical protein